MPTDTYHEQAKGVSRIWYVNRESLRTKQEIKIHRMTFDRAKEKIRNNGIPINPEEINSEGLRSYSIQVYSAYGARILIQELPFYKRDCCPRHADGYLTISARNKENLETIAERLGLPLEDRVAQTF